MSLAFEAGNQQPPNMALQRTRRPSLRSGRSLRSLGSPLNALPLGPSVSRARLVSAFTSGL